MSLYLSERHCRGFADAVTSVGGKLPDELASILAAMDAVQAWQPDNSESLAARIRKGELTEKNAGQLLDAARTAPLSNPGDVQVVAMKGLSIEFDKAVNGGAADAVIDSVRPAFDAAIAGVMAVLDAGVTPDTQAAQVLDLGDVAVTAWRDLPKHRQVLDSINNQVIGALIDTGGFNSVGVLPWMHPASTGVQRALFYVRDETVNILNAGRFMESADGSLRGGRWHRLLTTTSVQLNSLTRAQQLRTLYDNAEKEQQQREHLASHPPYVRG